MKKNVVLAGVVAAALFVAPGAMAGDWYVDVFGGLNDTNKNDFETVLGTIDTDYETGYLFGVAVGYQLEKLRLEGELAQRSAGVKSHALDGVGELPGADGDAKARSLMINAIYDFRKEERVSPYIGLGVGFAAVSLDGFGVDAVPDVVDDDDTSLAFQGIVGTSIMINDSWDFRIDGRYFNAPEAGFTTSEATGLVNTDADYENLSLTVGVRYSF